MNSAPTRRAIVASLAGVAMAGSARGQAAPDPKPTIETVAANAGGQTVELRVSRPAGAATAPIVLVAEAGPAFADLTNSACRALAQRGYLAVAPALGAGPDAADAQTLVALDAAAGWAGANGGDPGRLGIVGFGSGGRVAFLYDAHSPAVKAAVAWYGALDGAVSPGRPHTALDVTVQLHGPLLGLYGKRDGTPQRLLLEAEAKAKAAGRTVDIVLYAGAGQDFAAAGRPSFDEAASLDGWQRAFAWLKKFGVA